MRPFIPVITDPRTSPSSLTTVVAVIPVANPDIALNGIIVSAIDMSYYVKGIPKTTTLKTVSRRFGLPGLALSAGISGYEMYQNKKAGRGLFDDG